MRIKKDSPCLVLRLVPLENLEPWGGHKEFHRRHRELCEDTLLPSDGGSGNGSSSTTVSGCPSPGPGCSVLSLSGPPTPQPADIDSHPASRVLPFLYLGNGRDAADLQLLRALGTTRVLNVTSQLPGYHEERGITYRQIPASDSGHQNLKQYFEEAFDFIGPSIGLQVHIPPVAHSSRREKPCGSSMNEIKPLKVFWIPSKCKW
uniref:Uncharacterized protein n=1 Tax=Vespula pensylvanica TaxID=30213 RepID=A0A834U7M9_VESPE|nr:hypothetical protein H0235_010393 [Vespula pensylvanica]